MISLITHLSKVLFKIYFEKVQSIEQLSEEQAIFCKDRRVVQQILSLKRITEKYRVDRKMFKYFIDLKKAFGSELGWPYIPDKPGQS